MTVLSFITRPALQTIIGQTFLETATASRMVSSMTEFLRFATTTRYDAILIDADLLVFGDLRSLVKQLRQADSGSSLFVFASYFDLAQRLALLEAGVDDYVLDPFFMPEVTVRLSLSIRLHHSVDFSSTNTANTLQCGDLVLDLVRRTTARSGQSIALRPKEFLLLEYLVRNVDRPVTRVMIVEHLWQSSFDGKTNVVDVYIKALRRKLDQDFAHKLIRTNRGFGYTFTCTDSMSKDPLHPSNTLLRSSGA